MIWRGLPFTASTLLLILWASVPLRASQIYADVYENDFSLFVQNMAATGIVQSTLTPADTSRIDPAGNGFISQYASATASLSPSTAPTVRIQTYAKGETLVDLCSPYACSLEGDSEIRSQAFVSDTLSVTSGPPTGSLVFSYHLDGSVHGTGTDSEHSPFSTVYYTGAVDLFAAANPAAFVALPPSNEYFDGVYDTAPSWSIVNPDSLYTLGAYNYAIDSSLVVPYTHGVGSYELGLLTYAECENWGTGSCDTEIDFGSTLKITGLTVLDANGSVVPDAGVTSQSGLDYTKLSAAVPEPSLFLPVAGMVASLVLKRFRFGRGTKTAS